MCARVCVCIQYEILGAVRPETNDELWLRSSVLIGAHQNSSLDFDATSLWNTFLLHNGELYE